VRADARNNEEALMSKANHIRSVARSSGHRAIKRHPAPQGIQATARRVVAMGAREVTTSRVIAGVAVLGAAAAATAGVLERRAITKAAGEAMAVAAKLGRSMTLREPLYRRVLPGVGLVAGLLAAGGVALLLVPRLRGAGKEPARTERASSESAPWDPGGVPPGFGSLGATVRNGTPDDQV
jgi:hypothetical protein